MQEFIIFLIFAVALGYLGNRAYQSLAVKKAGCGKGCGCATDPKLSVQPTEKRI